MVSMHPLDMVPKAFAEGDLRLLASCPSEHRYAPARSDLKRTGDNLPGFGMVSTGWAMRYANLPGGRRTVLDVLLPGDPFGLDALIFQKENSRVQAITDVTYQLVTDDDLPRLLKNNSRFAHQLLWLVTLERRRLDRLNAAIARLSAEERIAGFLLDIHARLTTRRIVNGRSFNMPLTQQLIADHLGLTFVHVNRVLGRLHDAGLATVRHRTAIIHDMDGLRTAASYEDYAALGASQNWSMFGH